MGLVGPRVIERVGQSKQAAARTQIATAAQGLDALVLNPNIANWNGPHLKNAVPKDPWGNLYKYRCCPGQIRRHLSLLDSH